MDIVPKDVIKRLHNKKPCKALIENPLNDRVIHTNSIYYYIDHKNRYKTMSGLLPSLKKCFWPSVDINAITQKAKYEMMVFKTKQQKSDSLKRKRSGKNVLSNEEEEKRKKRKKEGSGRYFGSIRGTKVHKELEDCVLLDEKNYFKIHNGLHPWTKSILSFIREMGWTPLKAEHDIFNRKLMIATSIDMVCVNKKTGKLILLEFKTGYANYFEICDGNMEKSLSSMGNSPLNWATIQLTFSIIILMKQQEAIENVQDRLNYDDIEAYIIRVDDNSLDYYDVDISFIKLSSDPLFDDMKLSRSSIRRRGRKRKKSTTITTIKNGNNNKKKTKNRDDY